MNADSKDINYFLEQFQKLADKYLTSLEKITPIWEKRTIPITHTALNDFYCWVKNENKDDKQKQNK